MSTIKGRRPTTEQNSYWGLCVGICVPFYFCPRSVMLHVIQWASHPELAYRGGRYPILHLKADLHEVHEGIDWTERQRSRLAFILSNTGSQYSEDGCSLARLGEINPDAFGAQRWCDCTEQKQAQFWLSDRFPELCSGALVRFRPRYAAKVMRPATHRPTVAVRTT